MKEWTAAREHVAELKKTDPKSAIKLSNEITEVRRRSLAGLLINYMLINDCNEK